ncbi:MAG TPA: GPR1/FUN34/YaaH family transporter [Solirubrobacteraceae bacterium]|nr:GPR1/FUN34/YaaH family transporter [Solirubrobacteraceae bacterium]
MSTYESSRAAPYPEQHSRESNGHRNGDASLEWRDRTRIFLQPVAAPSILGLFGFASSTFMVAAFLAGWYGQKQGNVAVLSNLAPFCLFFGGLAQLLAGMWCYKARDGLGTAVHGMWGAFWMGFGILMILAGAGVLHLVATGAGGNQMVPFSYWFYTLAGLTGATFIVAMFKNAGVASVLFALACGSACVAIGYSTGVLTWTRVGGYALVASAGLAVYTATAMMLEESVGRVVLPIIRFPFTKREGMKPGEVLSRPQAYEQGMPGSRIGQ